MEDLRGILVSLHTRALERLADAAEGPPTGTNPKGDTQRPFDVAVDEALKRALEDAFESGIVLSEESGECRFGNGRPRYRFVVDPVDGSDNLARGLPLASVSVAVLQVDGLIALDRVVGALVGAIEEVPPIVAIRGEGAYRGDERLHVSGVRAISESFLSCELNHFAPPTPLAELLSRARAVRSYGCASRAISLVGRGALDAHIDVRDRLTPESYLAAALVLEEAGGSVVGLSGRPLEGGRTLTDRTSLVAAASPELALEITRALDGC